MSNWAQKVSHWGSSSHILGEKFKQSCWKYNRSFIKCFAISWQKACRAPSCVSLSCMNGGVIKEKEKRWGGAFKKAQEGHSNAEVGEKNTFQHTIGRESQNAEPLNTGGAPLRQKNTGQLS